MLEKFKNKQLDAQSMKQIKGGVMYECKCAAHAGTWTGNYQSVQHYGGAIANHCTGGGSCHAL
jgi:hypothetical protein